MYEGLSKELYALFAASHHSVCHKIDFFDPQGGAFTLLVLIGNACSPHMHSTQLRSPFPIHFDRTLQKSWNWKSHVYIYISWLTWKLYFRASGSMGNHVVNIHRLSPKKTAHGKHSDRKLNGINNQHLQGLEHRYTGYRVCWFTAWHWAVSNLGNQSRRHHVRLSEPSRSATCAHQEDQASSAGRALLPGCGTWLTISWVYRVCMNEKKLSTHSTQSYIQKKKSIKQ